MVEQDLCIKLVEAIEKHPCIYDFNTCDYSRKDLVDKAWEEVGREVKEEAGKCKDKWRNIRTVYLRHLKWRDPYGKRKRKPYYLQGKLQFLLPFLKTSDSSSTSDIFPGEKSSANSETCEAGSDAMNVFLDEYDDPLSMESTEVDSKRKVDLDLNNLFPRRKKEASETDSNKPTFRQSSSSLEEDPRRAFLISLLPDLRCLDDHEMRKFKRRALELVDKIIDERSTS